MRSFLAFGLATIAVAASIGGCGQSDDCGHELGSLEPLRTYDASLRALEDGRAWVVYGNEGLLLELWAQGSRTSDCPVFHASATANGIPMQLVTPGEVEKGVPAECHTDPTAPWIYTCVPLTFGLAMLPANPVDFRIRDESTELTIVVTQGRQPMQLAFETGDVLRAGETARVVMSPFPSWNLSLARVTFPLWHEVRPPWTETGISFVVPPPSHLGEQDSGAPDAAGDAEGIDGGVQECSYPAPRSPCRGQLAIEIDANPQIVECVGIGACSAMEMAGPYKLDATYEY